MASFFSDNADLQYYFDKGIDWAPLVELTEYGYRAREAWKTPKEAVDFYRQVAEMVGELAAETVAPKAPILDQLETKIVDGEAVPPRPMQELFEHIRSLELHGLCVPRELGGMNAPLLLYFINAEVLARADVSVMAHHSFHGGIAMALLAFSIQEGSTQFDVEKGEIKSTRFGEYIADIVAGNAWGCMDITEPDAGSDMAQLRAVGVQAADGSWTVSGQKIFITSGHGKYHFVIARTEQAPSGDSSNPLAGLAGLSMFLVKAYDDLPGGKRKRYVTLERLEDKMGHHGSVTAALNFDNAPAELIGERGEGFRYMLLLMNNARLGVGFESIGLCEAALRLAKSYAEQRRSMGKAIKDHEMIADYLDEMEVDIVGLRALAMHAAQAEETAQKANILRRFAPDQAPAEVARLDAAVRQSQRVARRATPLLKYLAAEKAVELGRRAMQILGGVGYMREYGAEKLLRDALVMPIYEGTSQIQSLMAMKDTLGGIIKRPQHFVRRLGQARWRSVSSRDALDRRLAKLQTLSLSAQQSLATRTATDKLRSLGSVPITEWGATLTRNWDPKRDFQLAMLHAERLTRILCDEQIAEILVAQAHRHPERREWAERWLDRAELRSKALHDEITTTGEKFLARVFGRAALVEQQQSA